MATLQMWILGALGFIAAFGLAVFVHELGHFLAAKFFGVHVERFVLGFDREAMPFMPRCIIEKKIGETTYGLSLVPLGGYVKMVGTLHPELEKYLEGDEEADARAKAEGRPTAVEQAVMDQAALYKKPFWQKTIIYSAGVIMNLLLAMAVVAFVNIKGREVDAPLPAKVAWQAPDSWATQQGFVEGEAITALSGAPIATNKDWADELNKLYNAAGDTVTTLSMTVTVAGTTGSRDIALEISSRDGTLFGLTTQPAYIDYVIINGPADKAGIRVGDTVAAIDGEPINDWYELVAIVRANMGKDLKFELLRDSKPVEVTVTPDESTDEDGIGRIGVTPGTPDKIVEREPFLKAVTDSPFIVAQNTVNYAQHLQRIVKRLFHLELQKVRQDLGGPVAIAQMAGRHAQLGLERWLQFLIMLNIALAVMNILPIPVLDGGHIVLAAFEATFRRPLPPRLLVPLLQGALFTILAFFILITFSDVWKIFS